MCLLFSPPVTTIRFDRPPANDTVGTGARQLSNMTGAILGRRVLTVSAVCRIRQP